MIRSMKVLGAFLKLIRWPNLVFIILTQLLYYYCIYLPIFDQPQWHRLPWLIAASVFIAAAGYIINDYFDLNIDQVNKPDQNVFNHTLHRRWAIIWHFLLSLLGVVATAVASGFHRWYLILANIGCVALLWFYSTSLKKRMLIGNIAIALLTAWTVLLLFFSFTEARTVTSDNSRLVAKLFRVSFLYAAFAFIISLIREAIKDMEDLEGDARYHCRTLPIVAGIKATRVYVFIWLIVLIAALAVLQLYVLYFGWWLAVTYSVIMVIIPMLLLAKRLSKSQTKAEFSGLSSFTKFIMFTGIVSMIFFRIYS